VCLFFVSGIFLLMKKKVTGETKAFVGLKLYKKHIEEIIDVLTPTFDNLEISDQDSIYDSIDELEGNKGTNIRELNFSNESPLFKLVISKDRAEITRGGEVETIIPYQQVVSILEKNGTPIVKVCVGFVSFFIALMILTPITRETLNIPHDVASVLFFVNGGLAVLSMIVFIALPKSTILLINKHEEKSFWKAKKYDLILDAVKVAVGFALGLLTAFLIYYFKLK